MVRWLLALVSALVLWLDFRPVPVSHPVISVAGLQTFHPEFHPKGVINNMFSLTSLKRQVRVISSDPLHAKGLKLE